MEVWSLGVVSTPERSRVLGQTVPYIRTSANALIDIQGHLRHFDATNFRSNCRHHLEQAQVQTSSPSGAVLGSFSRGRNLRNLLRIPKGGGPLRLSYGSTLMLGWLAGLLRLLTFSGFVVKVYKGSSPGFLEYDSK